MFEDKVKNKKILVVDDIETNLYALSMLLEVYEIQVVTASSAEAAIEKVTREYFDMVLMDVRMPGMDGFEAIALIREAPEIAQIPIIAVTAQAMVGDEEKCLAAGADDYISKPIDSDLLLQKMAGFF